MNYTIEFPGGRRVSAGGPGAAIRALTVTGAAFSGTAADPGGVCAQELAAEFFDDGLTCTAGDSLRLYRDGELLGTYTAQTPTTPLPGLRRVLAYDAVSKLDVDLTNWLEGLTQWPYPLEDFAREVCAACGLVLTGDLVNGDWPVEKFLARRITGRQLMQWVCQAGCRFCRALPDGTLKLCWLEETDLTLGRSGGDFYYQGSLTVADYTAAPTDGVCIALTDSDVGVVSEEGAKNVLTLRGNYLLCGAGQAQAAAIAQGLAGLSYTPCTLTTATPISPGTLFWVETERGLIRALAMRVEATPYLYRVECTGSALRTGSQAICRGDYQALSGRVLEIDLGLQGISSRMEAYGETQTRYSQLSQEVDQISARVGELEADSQQKLSALSLRADGLELTVAGISGDLGEKADADQLVPFEKHFVFDGAGLTIFNSATGMGIHVSEQQVAFTGGADPTTVITPNEMETTNLRIGRRMDVGDFALIPRTNGNLSLRCTGA